MVAIHKPSRLDVSTWADDTDAQTLGEFIPLWQDSAQCKGQPTADFFPDQDQPEQKHSSVKIRRLKKQFCAVCPVRSECLEMGLAMGGANTDFGLWGGTTPNQRRKIRAARAAGFEDPEERKRKSSDAKLSARQRRYHYYLTLGYCTQCAVAWHPKCRLNLQGNPCQCKKCAETMAEVIHLAEQTITIQERQPALEGAQ